MTLPPPTPPEPPADLRIDGAVVGTTRAYIGPCGSPLLAVRVDVYEPQHAAAPILFGTAAPAWLAPRRATKADLGSGRSFLIWTGNGWCQEVGGNVALGDWIMDQPPPPPGEERES